MASTPWISRLVERVEATMGRALFLQVLPIVHLRLMSLPSEGVQERVYAIDAARRGSAIVQRHRHLFTWLRKSGTTSNHASWVFRGASFVLSACCLDVSRTVHVIANGPLSLVFSADLVVGALVFPGASLVIPSSG
jgi:formate hydrogenlyase subunit 4